LGALTIFNELIYYQSFFFGSGFGVSGFGLDFSDDELSSDVDFVLLRVPEGERLSVA
jgi:hypothetical protein